uniref:Uncharacterized protein n=1 Tax=Anopheles epiroticus TaxID=199890 RepID=A0A182PTW9_9DIPT
MNRDKSKPGSNSKSKGTEGHDIFPDNETMVSRYVAWQRLLNKYNKPGANDDTGISIDEAVDLYEEDQEDNERHLQFIEEAIESVEDDEADKENAKSSNFSALRKELKVALKERTTEWKTNGLEQILNSNFSLSVDQVLKWLQKCQLGTGQQVSQERETRYTEYDGNTQMDVTCKENVSILNETQKKQLAKENSSSYVYSNNNQRRVVVHQVEKTTISSYITMEQNGFDYAREASKLNLNSLIDSMSTITPFKFPKPIKELNPSSVDRKPQAGLPKCSSATKVSGSALASMLESAVKVVPTSRVNDDIKNRNGKSNQQHREEAHTEANKPPNKELDAPPEPPTVRQFPMPPNYRQMLSCNGRCRYQTQGTVIYRPKQKHHGLTREAEKICIQTKDLDLSGVKSQARRKKFENFSHLTHPNSTLVYYMSESEDEVVLIRSSDSGESDDDDDPIQNFRPQLCILTFFNDEVQRAS